MNLQIPLIIVFAIAVVYSSLCQNEQGELLILEKYYRIFTTWGGNIVSLILSESPKLTFVCEYCQDSTGRPEIFFSKNSTIISSKDSRIQTLQLNQVRNEDDMSVGCRHVCNVSSVKFGNILTKDKCTLREGYLYCDVDKLFQVSFSATQHQDNQPIIKYSLFGPTIHNNSCNEFDEGGHLITGYTIRGVASNKSFSRTKSIQCPIMYVKYDHNKPSLLVIRRTKTCVGPPKLCPHHNPVSSHLFSYQIDPSCKCDGCRALERDPFCCSDYKSLCSECSCSPDCYNYGECCVDYENRCSCTGFCHQQYNEDWPCQCNDKCRKYNNCCHNYHLLCSNISTEIDLKKSSMSKDVNLKKTDSCEGYCGKFYEDWQCQCNAYCKSEDDCCPDFSDLCPNITDGHSHDLTESNGNSGPEAGIIVGCLLGIGITTMIGFIIYKYVKKHQTKSSDDQFENPEDGSHLLQSQQSRSLLQLSEAAPGDRNSALPLNDQANLLPYDFTYEIDRDKFKVGKLLGKGHFGGVYEGE